MLFKSIHTRMDINYITGSIIARKDISKMADIYVQSTRFLIGYMIGLMRSNIYGILYYFITPI